MSTITTSRLTKRYGRRIGVDQIDLSVPEGSVFGFLGPNGAGKTTTIRVLLGFLRPSAGRASVFGLDCWKQSPRIKQEVGYLPGDLRLYPWMTARNAISIVGKVRKRDLSKSWRGLSERFRLDPDVRVGQMSRGMRQKLGIVLALAHEPRLLVLDEPTSGLDPLMQDVLHQCLKEAVSRGQTVFFSSHRLSEVEDLCDRVAFIRDGRIVVDEALESLRERATCQVKLEFRDEAAMEAAMPPPASLTIRQRRGRKWVCDFKGDVHELIRWLVDYPVVEFQIGPPDLESLFRRFYERKQEGE